MSDYTEYGKQVPGYPNYYVSEKGQVFSVFKKGYLKPIHKKDEALMIQLYESQGRVKWIYLHRLVAILHVPNPKNLPFVRHIDGNTENNIASNLEWISGKTKLKLTPKEVQKIRALLEEGIAQYKIAKKFNISPSTISGIKTGKNSGYK